MPIQITPRYMAAARRFHDNHPEHEAAVHRAFLGGLGLSEEAQAEIVGRNAPELAHHPQIGAIGAMPKSAHAKAVAMLHESEQSGPDNENSQTDAYLSNRGKIGKREARAVLQRKGG
jgi:hypothetical protein